MGNARGSWNGFLEIARNLRLVWRLFRDHRVAAWIKSIPALSLVYLLWPVDILADPILGLGQVDDAVVLLLAMKLFVSLCPPALVREHQQRITGAKGGEAGGESDTIDTTYRVLEDEHRG